MNDNDGLKRDMDYVDKGGLMRIDDYHPNQSWYHWKPALSGSSWFQGLRNGIVTRQTFVSPSLGIFSFLYQNDQSESAYIEKAKHFLDVQASMTDYEKAIAVLANNKKFLQAFC